MDKKKALMLGFALASILFVGILYCETASELRGIPVVFYAVHPLVTTPF